MATLPCEGTYDGYEDRLYKSKFRLMLEEEWDFDAEEDAKEEKEKTNNVY